MELIINISDEIKSKISQMGLYRLTKDDIETVSKSISHGTRLPKGHGRLIDAKAYEQDICKHYFDNESVIRCTEIALSNAHTIIEADTESIVNICNKICELVDEIMEANKESEE